MICTAPSCYNAAADNDDDVNGNVYIQTIYIACSNSLNSHEVCLNKQVALHKYAY